MTKKIYNISINPGGIENKMCVLGTRIPCSQKTKLREIATKAGYRNASQYVRDLINQVIAQETGA